MEVIKSWEELPKYMRNKEVEYYYNIIRRRKKTLILKRVFDVLLSLLLLVVLMPFMLVIAIMIKSDSKGPVMFRQKRVTRYGRLFTIYKFRTMVPDAWKLGSQVTVERDPRVTKIGQVLRKYRLDEIPQLFNILAGDMSFVGTRPEVSKYVKRYTDEMFATLLLPAGVTSKASIEFKDEDRMLAESEDVDRTYVDKVLPAKMEYNLKYLRSFGLPSDFIILFQTVFRVWKG